MVNYRDQAADEVAQAKENRNNDNFSDLEQIEVDMGETPFVKFYPTVALTGTVPADEGNPIRAEQRSRASGLPWYRGRRPDHRPV